jgi:indolepyruvate ferredoxin oxidoreductase beta subunit
MSIPARPITLLIAALGGEGGGVLTDWIVTAAEKLGFPVQSTSIPGVAQRTGATTYYIEIVPVHERELSGRRPVLALTPGIADIDIAVASELMEAGRLTSNGFVTPDRTTLIASTSRFYAMDEKIAMADGRYDEEKLSKAISEQSKRAILFDMAEIARRVGSIISAVMLGALAGSGTLPISAEDFEAAIRSDAKAVDNNLRGFRAGFEAARNKPPSTAIGKKLHAANNRDLQSLEQEIEQTAPTAAREIMTEGVRRLVAYQDLAYAHLYLDRLKAIREADDKSKADGLLLRETARHLAVRMSFEDVIRVAQAKIDPDRMARVRNEVKVPPGEPYKIYEFLKPGIEEMCQVLPPFLAKPILRVAERRGWLSRFHLGMEINSLSVGGYLRFWLLAKLRRFRRRSHRYIEEQTAIESWLGLIVEAAKYSQALALEVAECARLIKGYGDTWKRGMSNYRTIETRLIRPAVMGAMPSALAADAIASARTAALADPEGESLARCLREIDSRAAYRTAAE